MPFLSPLPGFGGGSGSNPGLVGCLGAVLAVGFMVALLGGLLGLLVWILYHL
jgi:hypothetical protein